MTRSRCLARRITTTITIAMLAVPGCGGSTTTPPPAAFAIDGAWSYLGPSDVPHDLTVSNGSMVYTDAEGMWSSHWTIKAYDNALHHFQVTFDSGTGTYLPVGQSMSGTYDLTGSTLTTQLASGLASYPPLESPGSCTAASDGAPIPECRVYIKSQN
jgi:hypothetical protein